MADNDSPWKELLELEFPLALAFFLPAVHADLDWTRDHESLDQELRKLDPGGAVGKRIVDRLVKAWSKRGDPRYLHLEAQAKKQRHLPRRMFDYNVRCTQQFGQPVASFAILIDTDPKWRPRPYRTEIYGTKHVFTFVPIKILDWEGREEELRTHENPVALFVLAQLTALRTRTNRERRMSAKLELILLLQGRGMGAGDLRRWYRYLDWLLILPKEYDERIFDAIVQKEKETAVPYVTYAERRGLEKGREEGLEKGREEGLLEGKKGSIEAVLEVRFPQDVRALMPAVRQSSQMAELDRLLQLAKTASLEEVRSALAR
jgi:hypothetical protein